MKLRFFETILREICKENRFTYKSFSDGWLLEIKKGKKKIHTVGYNFDLNSAISQNIVNDKVLTSDVLEQDKISTIKYYQIHNAGKKKYLGITKTNRQDIEDILKHIKMPVVVKPTAGTIGRDVYLCKSVTQVLEKVDKITKTGDACISKFVESEFEYRFYVLKNKILLAYKKIKNKQKGEWRHNLSHGAKPEILGKYEIAKYQNLVLKTCKSLGLACGAVDILFENSRPIVLEVNSGIAMDHFISYGEKNLKIGKEIHKKMLLESFKKAI